MKVSLAWLKEFLNITVSNEELAEVMTLAGLEVEGTTKCDGDVIFDLSLTPNLGHCMSMAGVAREIAALLKVPMSIPSLELVEEGSSIDEYVKVEVHDHVGCPRYCCRVVEGIKVGPSPDWLIKKLEACGLRSVNNIVDATNFVMLGMGQPMHAFDLDKLEGQKIVVKKGKEHPPLLTLDEKERAVPEGTLMICDGKGGVAFAGVMGGGDSAVSEGTRRIVLEAACFDASVVKKMSKELGLRTDSSIRFEKGIDPNGVMEALDRATAIIQKIAGGKVAKGAVDLAKGEFEPLELTVRTDRANAILGTQLSVGEIVSIFERLQFEVVSEMDGVVTIKIPTYRNDIQVEIDLIEEIARIYGFNHIPTRPEKYAGSTIPDAPIYLFEKKARRLLLQEGMQEWMSCDLVSPEMAQLTHGKHKELISVLKPASVDQSVLRPTLLSSMLLSVKSNLDHQNLNQCAFEVGRSHKKCEEGIVEHACAGLLLMGKRTPYHHDPKPEMVDFFDIKGLCENFLEGFFVIEPHFERSHSPHFHPKQQAHIVVAGETVGILGGVHPELLKKADINKPLFFAQINLHKLFTCHRGDVLFNGLPLYPGSERDWTLTVKEEVPLQALLEAIKKVDAPHLEKIILLDLYKSDQIGKDRKNITLRFFYRDPNKTIAMETIEKQHNLITNEVGRQFIL